MLNAIIKASLRYRMITVALALVLTAYDTDSHNLDSDRIEQLVREAEAARAEEPDYPEIKAIEDLVDQLTSLRERTELLRGKVVKNITVMLCEDYSGYLGAELHHGKDDVDAPNEFCTCVFCGPEELACHLAGRADRPVVFAG